MNQTLSAEIIRNNVNAKDNYWIYRTLLIMRKVQVEDAKLFRKSLTESNGDRVENRNSAGYWLEWFTEGHLNRSSELPDVIKAQGDRSEDLMKKNLSREHLDNAVKLLTNPIVSDCIANYANLNQFKTTPLLDTVA